MPSEISEMPDGTGMVATVVGAPPRHRARLQVLTDDRAFLLLFGINGWQIEGVYD
jgi:hypothetical protein